MEKRKTFIFERERKECSVGRGTELSRKKCEITIFVDFSEESEKSRQAMNHSIKYS